MCLLLVRFLPRPWLLLRPRRGSVLVFLLGDAGVCAIVVADITVIHPSSLPSRQEFLSQVEQAGQLERPFNLFLPLRSEIRAQSLKQLPGIAVILTPQLLDQ